MMCRLSAKYPCWILVRLIFSAAFFLVLNGGMLQAQIATASLNGTVSDPSGAVSTLSDLVGELSQKLAESIKEEASTAP